MSVDKKVYLIKKDGISSSQAPADGSKWTFKFDAKSFVADHGKDWDTNLDAIDHIDAFGHKARSHYMADANIVNKAKSHAVNLIKAYIEEQAQVVEIKTIEVTVHKPKSVKKIDKKAEKKADGKEKSKPKHKDS